MQGSVEKDSTHLWWPGAKTIEEQLEEINTLCRWSDTIFYVHLLLTQTLLLHNDQLDMFNCKSK